MSEERARVKQKNGRSGRPVRVRRRSLEGAGGGGIAPGRLRTSRRLDWREGEARGCRGSAIGWSQRAEGTVRALQSVRLTGIAALSPVWSDPACPTVSSTLWEE